MSDFKVQLSRGRCSPRLSLTGYNAGVVGATYDDTRNSWTVELPNGLAFFGESDDAFASICGIDRASDQAVIART